MATDPQQVAATLVGLADTLVSDYDVVEYLDGLLESSVGALGAHAGGVMLSRGERGDGSPLQLLAATNESARTLELYELMRQEGPCIDSHRSGEPVVVEDLTTAGRWPQFAPAALGLGYRAVYAFPMRLRDSVIGALNLFRTEAGAVDDTDVQVAQAFADMATIGIMHQRAVREAREIAGQLQSALNSRVVIEQAKGVLAERLGYDMEHAYQVIRWYSRNTNRQIRNVAQAVIAGEISPDELRESPPTA